METKAVFTAVIATMYAGAERDEPYLGLVLREDFTGKLHRFRFYIYVPEHAEWLHQILKSLGYAEMPMAEIMAIEERKPSQVRVVTTLTGVVITKR